MNSTTAVNVTIEPPNVAVGYALYSCHQRGRGDDPNCAKQTLGLDLLCLVLFFAAAVGTAVLFYRRWSR